MSVAVGTIVIPGATGNQAVTGIGFQPVGVMFWAQRQHLGVHNFMFGASSGAGEEWTYWAASNTEISGYNGRGHWGRTDLCIANYSGGATVYEAEMVSLDSNGFTINWLKRGAGFENICYMAFGGGYISAAHAGIFSAGGSTGTVAVTAPGFTPAALVLAHGVTAFDPGAEQADTIVAFGLTDGTNQYSYFTHVDRGTAVDQAHIHRTDKVACAYDGTNTFHMELDSFDANGFTVDVTDAWTGSFDFGYMAIASEGVGAGNGIQPDSTGTQTITGTNITPGGVFFIYPGADAPSTTGATNVYHRPGVGAMAGATQEAAASGVARTDAPFGVWTSDGYQASDTAIYMAGQFDGGSPTNNNEGTAEFSAFAEDSFTLNWTSADSNDRAFGWLALPGELPFMPQIYRVIRVPSVA